MITRERTQAFGGALRESVERDRSAVVAPYLR